MSLYLYIFGSVTLVSLLSLLGVFFLSFSPRFMEKLILFMVSLSAGVLLGDSFLHLLPEAAARDGDSLKIWLWIIAGLLTFFVLEKIIHWRHCHIPTSSKHPHPLGIMNLVGDCLHNFFDGVIIAGSFLVNIPLGITTLIAIIAHEIPHEIGNFGVLLYAGYPRRRALLFNFLTALTAILGSAAAVMIGSRVNDFSDMIVPFTAGGFIYIATADLIPEMKKETAAHKSLYQLISIIIGVLIMLAFKIIFE